MRRAGIAAGLTPPLPETVPGMAATGVGPKQGRGFRYGAQNAEEQAAGDSEAEAMRTMNPNFVDRAGREGVHNYRRQMLAQEHARLENERISPLGLWRSFAAGWIASHPGGSSEQMRQAGIAAGFTPPLPERIPGSEPPPGVPPPASGLPVPSPGPAAGADVTADPPAKRFGP